MATQTHDVLVIGGGVIGLSLAYEMACRGRRVCVIDRHLFGREASWAGAGIIPPGSSYQQHPAVDKLATLGHELLPTWSRRLREETGIDNGWRVCGGLYLTVELDRAAVAAKEDLFARWQRSGIRVRPIDAAELTEIEPRVADSELLAGRSGIVGHHVPDEAQLRNPRHTKALVAACRRRGVRLVPNLRVSEWSIRGGRIEHVVTDQDTFAAGEVCLTAGCWTGQVARQFGLELPIRPVRGQIVLLRHAEPRPVLRQIVHWAGRYVVPRDDGRTLVGATVEETGFDKSTTAGAIDDMQRLAARLGLADLAVEQSWAGLRPATVDNLPILGRLPGAGNGWVAAGHFRAGLQMSPSTAVVMADLVEGRPPAIDVTALSAERFAPAVCKTVAPGRHSVTQRPVRS